MDLRLALCFLCYFPLWWQYIAKYTELTGRARTDLHFSVSFPLLPLGSLLNESSIGLSKSIWESKLNLSGPSLQDAAFLFLSGFYSAESHLRISFAETLALLMISPLLFNIFGDSLATLKISKIMLGSKIIK